LTDLDMGSAAADCRRDLAGIELAGNGVGASMARTLNFGDRRSKQWRDRASIDGDLWLGHAQGSGKVYGEGRPTAIGASSNALARQ
jgi:hypothetical protein